MKIKKNTLYFALVFILVVIGFFFLKGGNSNPSSGSGSPGTGDIQRIVLSFKDYNYYPNTIRVKVNQPVSISLDNSIQGCFRTFVIRDFDISKNLRTPQDSVDFTPTKTGTFRFACIMGMGSGTLIVE